MNESITNEFVLDNWFGTQEEPEPYNRYRKLYVEKPSAETTRGCWVYFEFDNGLEFPRNEATVFPVKRILVEAWEQVNE